MPVELVLPGRRLLAPKPPSYVALDMAFGVGNPAILGDKSRYRSHGTIVGAVPAAGVHGLCLDFNPALPSYVTIPAAHTQLDFIAADFSLIARLKIDSLAVLRRIFTRGRGAVDGYNFRVGVDGSLALFTSQLGANQGTYSGAGAIVIATWYTIGFSRKGAAVKVFRNGLDVTFTAGTHINPTTCARNAYIGIEYDEISFPMDGMMEFLRIFRGIALAASEHLAWHNALV